MVAFESTARETYARFRKGDSFVASGSATDHRVKAGHPRFNGCPGPVAATPASRIDRQTMTDPRPHHQTGGPAGPSGATKVKLSSPTLSVRVAMTASVWSYGPAT